MTCLFEWASIWNIPQDAVFDLVRRMATADLVDIPDHMTVESESNVQKLVRLQYARDGHVLWRNNVGVLPDLRGVPVRFGLANESAQMNKKIKSSDLIGIKKVYITPAMVGHVFGQFIALECKEPGWHYANTEHEQAQVAFIKLVIAHGGEAGFISG